MSDETTPKTAEEGFDARLEALERIVQDLEDGGLGLEQAIERYQQGIELLKTCHATLASTRKRVEELTEGAEEALRPLGGDPDFANEP
ncbi:MAG: exodeoxyribonuclease VII small subunit [Planctomycetota bacterium]